MAFDLTHLSQADRRDGLVTVEGLVSFDGVPGLHAAAAATACGPAIG